MKFNKLVPELTVTDLKRSLGFYVDVLGFKVKYSREESKFAFLSLEGSQIMVQEGKDEEKSPYYSGKLEYPFGRGMHFQVEVNDVKKYIDLLKKEGYPIKKELQDRWFRRDDKLLGMRHFLVMDPEGYLFLFHQDIGEKPI